MLNVHHLPETEDTNVEQAHRRMVVFVNLMGEEEFTFVVQGRDSVLSLLKLVESRTGIAPWQQRITYSGEHMTKLVSPDWNLLAHTKDNSAHHNNLVLFA